MSTSNPNSPFLNSFFIQQANVVVPIRKSLGLTRFGVDRIHAACGLLDTNSYDASVDDDNVKARGLFYGISRVNHSCVPNSWRFFDSKGRMRVVAAEDIRSGHEITLSYTPTFASTPLRQTILQRTKHFKCDCERCKDPAELGSKLAALRCSKCQSDVLPENPLNLNSDLVCAECGEAIKADKGRMMLDTAMKFAGSDSASMTETTCAETEKTMKQLLRFLNPTHHLIIDLKIRYVRRAIIDAETDNSELENAAKFLEEILTLIDLIAPGKSRLKGNNNNQYVLNEWPL